MKATYAEIDGKPVMLLKDPKTDSKKKSQHGRVVVSNDMENMPIVVTDGLTLEGEAEVTGAVGNMLETVFLDGKLLRDESLSEIRSRLHGTFN